MDQFPSNSKKAPPHETAEPKKIEKIVEGEVIIRKKPVSKRFLEMFVGDDAKGTWNYVLLDILLPSAKETLADAISQGAERRIFGEARSASRRNGARPGNSLGHIMYNNVTNAGSRPQTRYQPDGYRSPETRPISRRARAMHDFNEVILPTRVEAEAIIDRMFDILNQYEQVTVADLYDMLGVEGAYTDSSYGWNDLTGAGISRVNQGYLLNFPKPRPVDGL